MPRAVGRQHIFNTDGNMNFGDLTGTNYLSYGELQCSNLSNDHITSAGVEIIEVNFAKTKVNQPGEQYIPEIALDGPPIPVSYTHLTLPTKA